MKSKLIALLTAVLLMVSIWLPCYADEAENYDFHGLFQRVENMDENEKDTLSEELSSVFHNYPFEFIKALTLEDYALHDPVRKMLAEYNTSDNGNREYLQFLLSLFPQLGENLVGEEHNTFLTLLLAFDPDPRNAGEDFIATLFTALRYADGIGADQCSTILFRVFQQNPKVLVEKLSHEDQDFQQLAIIALNYGSWGHESEFSNNLNALAADTSLTEAQQNIVNLLLKAETPEEETTAPETEPETSTPPENEPSIPQNTELLTTAPNPEPSGGNTAVPLIAAAGILILGVVVFLAIKRKH